ncbi:MAG: heparan-alpha-glucosaminide N-acetyltransferase domain-containing protein [Ignavibacteriaceae bacterium]|nr:heparan-alpha-glucosaminide N-acetyltransferase domain-containing protein [Ignavibacteriaceae bacterium]
MAEKTRLLFIDLLRGWAILVMIEVHVFNAFMLPALRDTQWFSVLNFINGLVAPSFLFISGFAFIISTQNKHDELFKFGSLFWKKMMRIGLIFILGYSLHIPFFSLAKTIREVTPQLWISFYNVDILQNIGAGLLFILLARVFIKSNKTFFYFIFISCALFIFVSPFIWEHDFAKYFPLPIAGYFNSVYGSFFPLFPWIGFLLSGAVCSILYLKAREINNEKNFIIQVAALGIILLAAGHFYLSPLFPKTYTATRPHPMFFFERLGYVLIFLSLCWYFISRFAAGGSAIIEMGRESLLIYYLHLQIIYRKFLNGKSFDSMAGTSYGVWECIVYTILLIILMIITARIWGRFKKNHKKGAQYITAGVFSIAVILFLLIKNY